MPMQTVERLENVLRNTLVLQENIRSSMTALATKESLEANGDVADSTTRHHRGDRKALAKEREKKIAMGHKPNDHEEQKMV